MGRSEMKSGGGRGPETVPPGSHSGAVPTDSGAGRTSHLVRGRPVAVDRPPPTPGSACPRARHTARAGSSGCWGDTSQRQQAGRQARRLLGHACPARGRAEATSTPVQVCAATGHARTHLDPGDVQVQDAGHQEADAEHQQEQDGQTPRAEGTCAVGRGRAPGSSSGLWGHARLAPHRRGPQDPSPGRLWEAPPLRGRSRRTRPRALPPPGNGGGTGAPCGQRRRPGARRMLAWMRDE